MPLSEEEQRILHEMEQSLYEHDRAFVDRVRNDGQRSVGNRSLRWSALAFIAGFAVLVLTFRSSLLLGTCGFLVMLSASFLGERSLRQLRGAKGGDEGGPAASPPPAAGPATAPPAGVGPGSSPPAGGPSGTGLTSAATPLAGAARRLAARLRRRH